MSAPVRGPELESPAIPAAIPTVEEKLNHLIAVSDYNAQALAHLCTTFDQIVSALMASPMGAMIGKSLTNG